MPVLDTRPMAARLCPYCRELNSVGEKRCFRCGRRLPGPAADGARRVVQDLLGAQAPMTRVILFLQIAVFALCVIVDRSLPLGTGGSLLGFSGSFKASTMLRFGALAGPYGRLEPWRLLSAVFVHAGILHIGMNLWIFTSLGRELEEAIGSARFTLLFLLSGVFGYVASEWYYTFHPLTMGASGGVFGQIGAIVGILGARRDPRWKGVFVRNLIYALLLSVVLGNVNTAAHLGGFAAGIGLGYAFGFDRIWRRFEWPLKVLAGLSIIAVVASVGLSMRSPAWRLQSYSEADRGE